jgi:hypothetical protein
MTARTNIYLILKKYKEREYIAGIKNYLTGRIIVGAPHSKGLALLVRHPIGGDKWMD